MAEDLDETMHDQQTAPNGGFFEDDDEGFANPLADAEEDGERSTFDDDDAEGGSSSAGVDGTAALACKLVNLGVSVRWAEPLSNDENHELHRDLSAVLAKHDAPDMPYVEEMTLTMTLGGIIFRRAMNERAAAAAAAEKEQPDDLSRARKEGQRQDGFGAQGGGAGPSGEAASLLP